MNRQNIYERLTSSAKNTLNDYLEEVKDEILLNAEHESMKNDIDAAEIRLRDIISSIKRISANDKKITKKAQYWERLISSSPILGIVYVIIGLSYYFINLKTFDLNNKENVGILVIIMGVTIIVLYLFLKLLYDRREKQKIQIKEAESFNLLGNNYELLILWQTIEGQAKRIMEKELNKPASEFSITSIINFLSENYTKENKNEQLRELLSVRNKIAHETDFYISEEKAKSLINFSNQLIDTLDREIKKKGGELKIVEAIYGTKKNSFDIAANLNEKINDNKLEVIIDNSIGGDPDPGAVKSLKLTYLYKGVVYQKEFREKEKIAIP